MCVVVNDVSFINIFALDMVKGLFSNEVHRECKLNLTAFKNEDLSDFLTIHCAIYWIKAPDTGFFITSHPRKQKQH